jgi:hypothetical protein
MNFIKYIDFFTIKFKFYTNNRPNYQNIFGGIMSFIFIIFCIPIIIALTYEDIKKMNPATTTSEINNAERKLVNMSEEKIWIPFRMVNYENKFIDHRGILYIVPYLIEGKFKEGKGMDLKYHLLEYKLCNETSMRNKPENYKIDIPLNELFCFERDDILFGGNWNHKFLYYIELNLYLCENGVAYNESDPKCSKINNYLKTLNSSLLIDFYFPIVQFQPKNINTPIEIIYKNYFYRLTTYSYKVHKLYIKEHIFSDDPNIIKNDYKNSTTWGMSLLYSDDYFLPVKFDPISNNSNTSRIFALNIYMDDGLLLYTRSFKKIFVIISNVFPTLRIFYYFMKKITQHFKMSITKRKLIGMIFENKRVIKTKNFFNKKLEDISTVQKSSNKIIITSNKSEKLLINDSINNHSRNLNEDLANHQNATIFKKTTEQKDKHSLFNSHNIMNSKLQISINEKGFNKKMEMNENFFYKPIKTRENPKNNLLVLEKKTKFIFPFYYFLLDALFDNLINPQRFFCISKNYFTVYNFMCQVYDISTHILLFKQFSLMNAILKQTKYEGSDLNKTLFFDKINIGDNMIMEKINNNLKTKKSIVNYDSVL